MASVLIIPSAVFSWVAYKNRPLLFSSYCPNKSQFLLLRHFPRTQHHRSKLTLQSCPTEAGNVLPQKMSPAGLQGETWIWAAVGCFHWCCCYHVVEGLVCANELSPRTFPAGCRHPDHSPWDSRITLLTWVCKREQYCFAARNNFSRVRVQIS